VTPPAYFFNLLAQLDATGYPQDAAGGEVQTPAILAIMVPCCVQSDPPESSGNQQRRGSTSAVRVFFRPGDARADFAIRKLKVNDNIVVTGYPNPINLLGPAVDEAGRGAVYECSGRDIR
jgi:hypothetical protein